MTGNIHEDIILFDKWREEYDSLNHEQQRDFYNEIERYYPEQKSFTLSNYDYLFANYQDVSVTEIGGWKGELADYCLNKYFIKSWTNFEITSEAIKKSVCHDERYNPVLVDFNWMDNTTIETDVCLASHVIEHLSDKDLIKLIKCIKSKVILFEAPISQTENDWKGYPGTHILKMGWDKIDSLIDGKKTILHDSRMYER
jgi:hypothetical protein